METKNSDLLVTQNDIIGAATPTVDRELVPFLKFSHLYFWRPAAFAMACLLLVGCVTRKAASPPTPVYPPTLESALRGLRVPPHVPYARIQTITVAAVSGKQFDAAVATARQSAAQKGANALVVLEDRQFWQRVGKGRVRVHRITYLAIWYQR